MQLHNLSLKLKKKSRKRIGRGGKKGTYSGRGIKGQKARSGKGPRAGFAGGDTTLLKRLPKKRGVVGKVKIRRGSKLSRFKNKPVVLNLKDIDKKFKDKEVISPKTLLEKGLIDKINKRIPKVKILGEGESKKNFVFKGIRLSEKIRREKSKVKKTTKTKKVAKTKKAK